jgi:hypothetical protein
LIPLALNSSTIDMMLGANRCPYSFIVAKLYWLQGSMTARCSSGAVGIAPQLRARHHVVQALCRRRNSAQTVKALAPLARVDRLSQPPVLQKVSLLDVNRRAGSPALFVGGFPAFDSIPPQGSNLVGQPDLHHVPRFAPFH